VSRPDVFFLGDSHTVGVGDPTGLGWTGHVTAAAERAGAAFRAHNLGLRGDTAAGGASKQATLETGLAVRVPLFIKEGEVVRVNTQTGEVAGRA